MNKNSKIYVAGHTGMVGSAIVRELKRQGYENIVGKTIDELDLTNQAEVKKFFEAEKPEYVFLVAANVGGIEENRKYPAEHLTDNVLIELNIMQSALTYGCKNLLFISSNCMYPAEAELPIKEESILSGKLDENWEAYGIAKIMGVKLCEYYSKQYAVNYFSVIPCNLYGINDCYDPSKSHVIAAMIRRFHEAKKNSFSTVEIWGDGTALRELLYADDLADACIYLIDKNKEYSFINITSGYEMSIKDIAYAIKEAVGYDGEIVFNTDKPGGIHRKNMSCEKLNSLGWKAKTEFKDGIKKAYDFYKNKVDQGS